MAETWYVRISRNNEHSSQYVWDAIGKDREKANENDYVIEDSLIPTDTNDFKEDYNYLLYRYSNGMVKSKKKHWYNFNRK